MAGVAITLVSSAVSGGSVGPTISTTEYADSAAAVAAITNATLPVVSPVDTATGTSLKKRHIPVASIYEIVSL